MSFIQTALEQNERRNDTLPSPFLYTKSTKIEGELAVRMK